MENISAMDEKKFYTKQVKYCINRINAQSSTATGKASHNLETESTEKLSDKTVNLTPDLNKEKRRKKRKNARDTRRRKFKAEKRTKRELRKDEALEKLRESMITKYNNVFSAKLRKVDHIECDPVKI